MSRVTISAGLRFDWLRESVKATVGPGRPAGAGAQSFPARTDVPNWKDLNPRFGIVWDPTGSAKTAIKFGINRYVQSNTTGLAQLFDQAAGAVNSTTRSWNDQTFPVGDPRRGNFLPDCDLVRDDGQRRVRRDGQPQLRHLRAGELAGSRLDHGLGQADRTTGRRRSTSIARCCPNVVVNAGLLPHVVRQLPGDRQPARDAGRLQPLLRDRAGGRRGCR